MWVTQKFFFWTNGKSIFLPLAKLFLDPVRSLILNWLVSFYTCGEALCWQSADSENRKMVNTYKFLKRTYSQSVTLERQTFFPLKFTDPEPSLNLWSTLAFQSSAN